MQYSDNDILWAIDRGYLDAARFAMSADPDARKPGYYHNQDSDEPLLHSAVRYRSSTIVEAVLNTGVDIDTVYGDYTAVGLALDLHKADIAILLLEHGPDMTQGIGNGVGHPFSYLPVKYEPSPVVGDLVRSILKAGADPNHPGRAGWPIIMSLTQYGHADGVASLIRGGADVNQPSPNGLTALTVAACRGYIDIVRILIDAGADVNRAMQSGNCPLIEAIRHGRPEIESTLRAAGAVRPSTVDMDLNLALMWRDADVVRKLVEDGADLEIRDAQGQTPLHNAIAQFPDVAVYLIEHGADIDARVDCDGYEGVGLDTLMMAVRRNRAEVARELIRHGANPNGQMTTSWSGAMDLPVNVSVYNHAIETAKALLEMGANIDDFDNNGETPLIVASRAGVPDIVRLLLEHGADPNARQQAGKSSRHGTLRKSAAELIAEHSTRKVTWLPPHYSQPDVRADFAKIIADFGLEVPVAVEDTSDDEDDVEQQWSKETPNGEPYTDRLLYQWSTNSDVFAVRDALANGLDPVRPWLIAAEYGSVDILQYLLDAGVVDIDVTDEDGRTALLIVAMHVIPSDLVSTSITLVDLLIKRGANVNHADSYGNTSLTAVFRNAGSDESIIDVVEVLLNAGADPNIGEEVSLVEACEEPRVEIVELLLKAGADPNRVNRHGDTALLVAIRRGHSDLEARLREAGAVEPPEIDTELRTAIRWNKVDAVVRLARGADLEARDEDGLTPLLDAVSQWPDGVVVAELLRAGADPMAIMDYDYASESTADIAARRLHWRALSMLVDAGVPVVDRPSGAGPVASAIEQQEYSNGELKYEDLIETLKILLASGADPNAFDGGEGMAAIHRAVGQGLGELVELLLDHGADIDIQSQTDNAGGETALHYALRYGHTAIAESLLARGANPNLVNNTGSTPMMEIRRNGEYHESDEVIRIIDLLIRAGADINAIDDRGRTFLDDVYDEDLQAFLVERGAVSGHPE